MARYICIACEVFARPIYMAAAKSAHVIDIQLIERGLHNRPEQLRSAIQRHIDATEGQEYHAVLLGYGLCGNGTAGLRARSTQLVIPRAHDCIALLLGGQKRYQDQFNQTPGTYWYSQDFLERRSEPAVFSSMGPISVEALADKYDEFVARFGQDNADYLMSVMGAWQGYYQRAAFIHTGITEQDAIEEEVEREARQRGWLFETLAADLVLIHQLLNGDWALNENENFVIIPPCGSVDLTYDDDIFKCGA